MLLKSKCALLFAAAVLSVSAAQAADKQSAVKPQIVNDSTIVCGNKKVALRADGTLKILNAAGEVASINPYSVFKNKKNDQTDWVAFTPALCKMRRDGNKIIWELWKKHELLTWKLADQTLEVMPDGLLKLSVKFNYPDNAQLVPRNKVGNIFLFFPVAGNEGKTIVFQGKKYTLAKDMKGLGAWRGKLDYELFPDLPEQNIGLTGDKVATSTFYTQGKRFRLTYVLPKDRSGSFFIDLRKGAKK